MSARNSGTPPPHTPDLRQWRFDSPYDSRTMATSAPLINLTRVQLAYGHHRLLDDANFTVHASERIGLIGRNGTGKSSLLRLLDGRAVADDGELVRRSRLVVATVEQEPTLDEDALVLEVILGKTDLTASHDTHHDPDWQRPARAHAMLAQLGLAADLPVASLSGGLRKLVALARALVNAPDLLLLDEPTNHLDFDGIAWLEACLRNWRGAAVIVTHDRRFLDAVATHIVELERGRLLSFPGDFSAWQARKAQWLTSEALQQARFDKLLAQEEAWIRQGIEARRTRNEGRVRRLEQLRRERLARRERTGQVSLALTPGERSGKLVAELQHIHHAFGERVVIADYSTTLLRGDHVGIIGPNGAGKTTLVKILLGELTPSRGRVRRGTGLSVAYFDQMRAQLDENATLADTISPGSDWVEVGKTRKHVMSYLGDFLFEPARARSPVASLSGGERARLLLARLFARPANVLVLDEPTNDLDIETLELLETLLQDYPGTVLLISHDRAFLNNVVTQTIAFEGAGHWRDYPGGYDDWLTQRPAPAPPAASKPRDSTTRRNASSNTSPTTKSAARVTRLASWEQRELAALPDAIDALEREQSALNARLSDASLYRDAPAEVAAIQARLAAIETELLEQLERWEQFEARNQG